MEEFFLTPEQILYYDPNHKIYDHYRNYVYRKNRPSPYWIGSLNVRDHVQRIQAGLNLLTRHSLYVDQTLSALAKCGPQGDVYDYSTLETMLDDYYTVPEFGDLPEILKIGRDYLVKLVDELVLKNGIEINTNPKYYATNSGSPLFGHKGDVFVELLSSKAPFAAPMPNVMGQRHMRDKLRAIFMDAVANIRELESEISSLQDFLKKHLPFFASWLNPAVPGGERQQITAAIDQNYVIFETDYIGMDQHFSKRIALEMVYPVVEAAGLGSFAARKFIGELFHQTILLYPNKIRIGEHTLFSGQLITNPFETIYTVELFCGACLKHGIDPFTTLLLAQGDDALLGISPRVLKRHKVNPETFLQDIIDASNAVGMAIHPRGTKTQIRQRAAVYCRKAYYPAGRRDGNGWLYGAYPTAYALNNIIQPERHSETRGQAAVATLQRLDVAFGSPDFEPTVQYVDKMSTLDLTAFDSEDIRRATDKDWWYKVYGESWQPSASPSYLLLSNKR